ncbi:uncharacterized protein LOC128222827 [Mya arenaria]|uniref:uncharacterized protein LOC128222827 n=1 Tax=Mya arenaria TaxID=6604 RepID=UPI0022E324AC|nr:uncharacterized protein LOC128222827 [Mya arenaria]XP_052787919.1 uncharacterized protein LOC128222827 [Mya arenaria]XP_052787920.1 uncharacterized protein LOC128222827 [Mya arenaria]
MAQTECSRCNKFKFYKYRDEDNELIGVRCTKKKYGHEWLTTGDQREQSIVFEAKTLYKYTFKDPDQTPIFQTKPDRDVITAENLSILKKGDNIAWLRKMGIWHHALIAGVNRENRTFSVYHFQSDKESGGNKVKVVYQADFDVLQGEGPLYRINYGDIPSANTVEIVLARAKNYCSLSKRGKYCYNFFLNNCENFVTYCKTGLSISYQWKLLKQKLKGFGWGSAIRCFFQYVGEVSVAELIELTLKASNVVGAVAVVITEFILCLYDVYHIVKGKESVDVKDKAIQIVGRIVEFICRAGLGAGFSYLFGVLFSSFIGSVIGGFFGLVIGMLVGVWLGNRIRSALSSCLAMPEVQ